MTSERRRRLTVSRLAALVVLTVAVASSEGDATAAEAAPRGVGQPHLLARLPPTDLLLPLRTVRTDARGDILAIVEDRVVTFTAAGELVGDWSIPDPTWGDSAIVGDIAPDGTVYAAPEESDTIFAYSLQGHLLRAWSGTGGDTVNGVEEISFDPRGSVVVADQDRFRSFDEHSKRFSPTGEYLGRVPGPMGQATTIAASGSRWVTSETMVLGVRASGREFQEIGRDCQLDGHDDSQCVNGIGGFGASPPTDLAAAPQGGLAVTESSLGRLQVFDRYGRLQFACWRQIEDSGIGAITYVPRGNALLLGVRQSIYRAPLTKRRSRNCRGAGLRVSHTHLARRHRSRHRWTLGYRLSHAAAMEVVLRRMSARRCDSAPPDRFDPSGSCLKVTDGRLLRAKGHKGRNRMRLTVPRGRWYVQLKALDHDRNGFDTPFHLVPR